MRRFILEEREVVFRKHDVMISDEQLVAIQELADEDFEGHFKKALEYYVTNKKIDSFQTQYEHTGTAWSYWYKDEILP